MHFNHILYFVKPTQNKVFHNDNLNNNNNSNNDNNNDNDNKNACF